MEELLRLRISCISPTITAFYTILGNRYRESLDDRDPAWRTQCQACFDNDKSTRIRSLTLHLPLRTLKRS